MTLVHEFVESFPDKLEEATLYVSMEFATVAHSCACGCGHQVITPLSPADWQLIYDGDSISLRPSIGNWSFDCQSHYWIENSKVRWAQQWSREEIESTREYDRNAHDEYFSDTVLPVPIPAVSEPAKPLDESLFKKLVKFFKRIFGNSPS